MMNIVTNLSMNTTKYTFRARIFAIQLIASASFMVVTIMLQRLLNYGTCDDSGECRVYTLGITSIETYYLAVAAGSLVVGMIIARVSMFFILSSNQAAKIDTTSKFKFILEAIFLPFSTEFLEMLTLSMKLGDQKADGSFDLVNLMAEFQGQKAFDKVDHQINFQ